MFEQITKEISKREIEDESIILNCKLIKNYTRGEIFINLEKIDEILVKIYNKINPHIESIKEGLRIAILPKLSDLKLSDP